MNFIYDCVMLLLWLWWCEKVYPSFIHDTMLSEGIYAVALCVLSRDTRLKGAMASSYSLFDTNPHVCWTNERDVKAFRIYVWHHILIWWINGAVYFGCEAKCVHVYSLKRTFWMINRVMWALNVKALLLIEKNA